MRFRIQNESKWYKSLRFARVRAIDARRGRAITVNVVDESGKVVWSTDQLPKMTVHFRHTEEVTPKRTAPVEPQGDLF